MQPESWFQDIQSYIIFPCWISSLGRQYFWQYNGYFPFSSFYWVGSSIISDSRLIAVWQQKLFLSMLKTYIGNYILVKTQSKLKQLKFLLHYEHLCSPFDFSKIFEWNQWKMNFDLGIVWIWSSTGLPILLFTFGAEQTHVKNIGSGSANISGIYLGKMDISHKPAFFAPL